MEVKALNIAIEMIKPYVLRGDDYESLRAGGLASYCSDYSVSIGGWNGGKKYPNDKIIVTRVKGVNCLYEFSLKKLFDEILINKKQLGLFSIKEEKWNNK